MVTIMIFKTACPCEWRSVEAGGRLASHWQVVDWRWQQISFSLFLVFSISTRSPSFLFLEFLCSSILCTFLNIFALSIFTFYICLFYLFLHCKMMANHWQYMFVWENFRGRMITVPYNLISYNLDRAACIYILITSDLSNQIMSKIFLIF